jgi:hypothetical protein
MSQTRAQLIKGFSNTSSPDDTITVDSSGQVGIGQTSPAGLLHIAKSGGNAKLLIQRSNTAANTNDYGSILWQSSAANNNALIGAARHSAENDAYMFFSTASGGSLQEELRIQSAGGISFNGDTAQTNALHDYEEGTWSPGVVTGTVNHADAKYIKIGNFMKVCATLTGFSNRTSSNIVQVNNVPYSNSQVAQAAGSMFGRYLDRTAYTSYVKNNGGVIEFYSIGSGNFTNLQHTHLNNASVTIYLQASWIIN